MTDRRTFLATGGSAALAVLAGCATGIPDGSWTVLVDGSKVPGAAEGWTALGEGNWSVAEGTLQGKGGKLGYLLTPASYTDFEIRAEFWADEPCNSGIFIRCQSREKVGADSAYEVNIFDKRPDSSHIVLSM